MASDSCQTPATKPAAVGTGGGLLLAICFFLPAIRSCGGAAIPYKIPIFSGPYLFGLVSAIAFLTVLRNAQPRRATVVTQLVIVVAVLLFFGIWFHYETFEGQQINGGALVQMLLWWPIAVLAATAFGRGRSLAQRLGRASWTTSAVCLVWFVPFVKSALYGLWLSIAGSCLLLIGGATLEAREKTAKRKR